MDTFEGVIGSIIVAILKTKTFNSLMTERFLETAYGDNLEPEQKIIMNEDGDYVTIEDVINHRLVKIYADKVRQF